MSEFLPDAVRRAAERADQMIAQQNQPPAPEGTQPGNDAPAPEGTQPGNDAPADQQPPAQQPSETIDWEHRYKSAIGRLEAEQRNTRAMAETIRQLEQRMEELAAQQRAPSTADDVLSTIKLDPVTDDEINEFGPEVASFIERQAAKIVRPLAEKLAREQEDLKRQVNSITESAKKGDYQRMLDRLDSEVPEWRQINTDQAFLDWLNYPDRLSGQIRRSMLQDQYKRNNADSVIAFFQDFLREANRTPAAPQPHQPEKIPLEQFAAPGRSQPAAPPPGPADKPIITRADIADYYARKSRGEFRGREAEAEQAEAMIFAAQQEGRVR